MRIFFIDSGEIWSNTLAKGLQLIGHDVMISGHITQKNLQKNIKEFKPQLAITVGWGTEHTKEKQEFTRKVLDENQVPLVYWAVEDPAYKHVWSIPFVKGIKPAFVFTICPETIDVYKQLGIPSAHLDFGYEESVHKSKFDGAKYDIAIVANAYPDILQKYPDHFRHQSLKTLVQPLLHHNIRIDFWGKQWDKMHDYFGTEIPSEWIHGPISYLDAYKIYNSSKIMIGLQNYPHIVTQRTYEALGSGGFFLTLDTQGVRSLFEPGKDLVTSSSERETVEKVNYYLKQSEERIEIQQQGNLTVKPHSYETRAKKMMDILIKNGIIKRKL